MNVTYFLIEVEKQERYCSSYSTWHRGRNKDWFLFFSVFTCLMLCQL